MSHTELVSQYERRVTRRRIITSGLAAAAAMIASADATLTVGRRSKKAKELEQFRPHATEGELADAQNLVINYTHCQDITGETFDKVVKPDKLAEIRNAEALTRAGDIFTREYNTRIMPEENRLVYDVLAGLVIPTLAVTARAIFEARDSIGRK